MKPVNKELYFLLAFLEDKLNEHDFILAKMFISDYLDGLSKRIKEADLIKIVHELEGRNEKK